MRYVGCQILLQYSQIRYFQSLQTCYKTSHRGKITSLLGLIMVFTWIKVVGFRKSTVGNTHNANTHSQNKTWIEAGGRERWCTAAARRGRRKTPESTGSNLQQDVSAGAHMHMHMQAHTDKHTSGKVCARVVAVPALGSSLTHVDRTLEPLEMEPSGSVCPVHQPAFTEVPGTTPIPASRDWKLKWTHQFNSLLLTHQTADGLINIWSFRSKRTWLHI